MATGEELLERARELIPTLRERAAATEELRRVPDETVKDLQAAGLQRALQPERWGGSEASPRAFYEAIVEVGTACASSAWVLGVVGVHNWQLALFDERAQQDVWADDPSVQISSSYAPTGQVERADGGYRVSGRWSFSSGCDHCQWVFLGGVIPAEDGGAPDMRTFLIPRADYEIDDNWHVAGLAGTGSKDIVVQGAFVPEHRTHRFVDAFNLESPGQATNPGPLYRLPFGSLFAYTLCLPAIGAAWGALQTYTEQSRARFSMLGGGKVAENPFAQVRLAEASAAISDGRARVGATWDAMMATAEAGTPISVAQRAAARWESANTVDRCIHAVDRLFEASGGRGIFLSNPIQRAWRDVHAMRAHAINNPDEAARLFGSVALHPDEPPTQGFL